MTAQSPPRSSSPPRYELSHLDALEAESIHIIREVAAEFERPVLLFSGGKDSVVMLHLAEKAFWPAPLPFPVMHVDTGHNFDEVHRVPRPDASTELGAAAGRGVGAGRHRRRPGGRGDRPAGQPQPAADRHAARRRSSEHRFDAVFGGARRDEEKARAKERVFCFRDEFGQWDPKNQRPELWSLYNGRHRKGEHIRVFPLSNWTELDIWQYIARRGHRAARRSTTPTSARSSERDGMLLARDPVHRRCCDGEESVEATGALPHGRRRDLHRRGRVVRRDRRRRRSPRSPPAASPSAAPPAPTTGSPKPAWKTARRRGTSDVTELLRVRHRRLGRRRQVHAHRPAALRHQVDLRGPARGGRAHQPRARRRVHQPRAAHRRPAGRARAGHHDRRRLPLLRHAEAQVHHRRHPGPHPVHAQHGHRRVDRRPRADPDRRPQRRARAVAPARVPRLAAAASRTSCCASTRWTSSTTTQERFEEIKDEFRAVRHQARRRRPDLHPDLGAHGRQRRHPHREHALVRGHVAAAPPRGGAHRVRPQPDRRAVPGAVRASGRTSATRLPRLPRLRRHVAGGVFKPGDEVVVLPSGFTSTIEAHRHRRTAPVDEAFAADVGHARARPTTSTSAAAT